MDALSSLFVALDSSTKTLDKLQALQHYFEAASEQDSLWVLWLFSGNTLRRAITATQLKEWAAEAGNIPRWLFDECYIRVGDLAETVALCVAQTETGRKNLELADWMKSISELRTQSEVEKRQYIVQSWRNLSQIQRFIFTKLITGGFRVGVSRGLTVRALAAVIKVDAATLMHALTGNWHPFDTTLMTLTDGTGLNIHPYPFFLASPVGDIASLGEVPTWQFEWKWDGIRGQIVKRDGEVVIWSRGEELITDQFPELKSAAQQLPDGTVLDGEIVPWRDGPLGFSVLQRRLGRKTVTMSLQQSAPVAFIAYDLLEDQAADWRSFALSVRRCQLEEVVSRLSDERIILSPLVQGATWAELGQLQAQSRVKKAEGLMIKRADSPYRVGRVRGDWWKWKVAPLSVDAVMINAQRGHGRRSGVYSDYTFAVRDGEQLVPFAKAYSGLTDKEIRSVDQFVKKHVIEKFGPVRTVVPELVFEIGFEGISASKRHKSGVAVRFPRILRQRPDKPVAEIDTIETLQDLLRELS